MTILIVEDNAGIRRLLRDVVAGIANQIWECEDGADALDAYRVHLPQVVLMDIRMPRMDGLAATRRIRQFDASALVVIVTDYEDVELRTAAREAGACGYALKENLLDLTLLIGSIVGTDDSAGTSSTT